MTDTNMAALHSLSVLLVEDSPTDVLLAQDALEQDGEFSLTVADRLETALAFLESKHFDTVLLDLGLPDSLGLDTLRRLLERDFVEPVIVMTARDDVELALQAMKEGADDYLIKSQIQDGGLRRAIRYAVERKKAQAKLLQFAEFLESSNQAMISLDMNGVVTHWNRGAEWLFGIASDDALAKPLCGFFDAECEQELLTYLQQLKQDTSQSIYREHQIPGPDDAHKDVSFKLSPIKNKTNKPVGVLLICDDITQNKIRRLHRDLRFQVGEVLASETTTEKAFQQILQLVCTTLDCQMGAFLALDRQQNSLRCVDIWTQLFPMTGAFSLAIRKMTFGPDIGLPGRVWSSGKAVFVPDIRREHFEFPGEKFLGITRLKSAVGFPVVYKDQLLGVLTFFTHRPLERLDELVQETLTLLCLQIGIFIDRQQTIRLIEAEHACGEVLLNSSSLSEAAQPLIRTLSESLGLDIAELWELPPQEKIQLRGLWHKPDLEISDFLAQTEEIKKGFGPGDNLPFQILTTSKPYWNPDISADLIAFPRVAALSKAGIHGVYGIPLKEKDKPYGVMLFFSRSVEVLDDFAKRLITSITSQIGVFVVRKQTEQRLLQQQYDRDTGAQIQQALLPALMPVLPGFQIAAKLTMAQQVGGDCFDFIRSGADRLGILVADASGHGIGSALMATRVVTALRFVATVNASLSDLFAKTNDMLAADDCDHSAFVTALLVELDVPSRTIRWVGAGHPPGIVLDGRGNVKAFLDSTGLPFGMLANCEFPPEPSITLDPGDLMVLYTDGIVEAMAPNGQLFKMERLIETVRSHQHCTPGEILEALFNAVHQFAGQTDFADDATAIVVKANSLD